MNNYEDWALLVAKKLKGEADLIAAIEKDELEDTAATEAFVQAVLKPFLPENYGIGSGRIVDAFGNYSNHLEVVVYNRDFPRIGIPGTHSAYIYESVLAIFSIRAKFIRKTFFESLDACASMAQLETNIDKTLLIKLAKKNGLKPGPNKKFFHDDPLRTARFELIGRPPGFVFGFSGIKNSQRQLKENLELWLRHRDEEELDTSMKCLPAVIATQGCFAWRNAAPLALSSREMMGIGNDFAPIRLIVLQLLYLLNRRLHVTADGYGLKPNLNAYLSQFSAPKFDVGVGKAVDPREKLKAARDTMRFEPARDHTPKAARPEAAAEAKKSEPAAAPKQTASKQENPEPPVKEKEVVAKQENPEPPLKEKEVVAKQETPEPPVKEKELATPVKEIRPAATLAAVSDKPSQVAPAPAPSPAPAPAAEAAPPVPEPKDATPAPAAEAAVFDKPSPFASAPSPSADQTEAPSETQSASGSGVFDKPSPFASAPVPPAEEAKPETPRPAARVSSLGSAPIPMSGSAPISGTPPAAPLGSAPIPTSDSIPAAGAAPATAPLGSAPIPPASDSAAPGDSKPASTPSNPLGSAPIPPSEPKVAKVIPAKPPVDFDLGSETEALEDKVQAEEDEFENTVIIPPNAGASTNAAAKDSTNAFIARVKEQLSSPDAESENKQDSFTSTVPQ